MNKKYKYLLKNVGILFLGNFSSKILVFLLVPLYTSVLSTEEYGTYDLMYSLIQILLPILTLNIISAVMRFLLDQNTVTEEIASIGLKFILQSILIVMAGSFLAVCTHVISLSYGVLIFAYYVFYSLNQYFIHLAKGRERVRDIAAAGVLSSVTMLSCNLLFLLVFEWGLTGFFAANIVGQAMPACYYAVRLRESLQWKGIRKGKKSVERESTKKQMLAYSVPLITSDIAWWINNASDKYVVAWLCGVGASGILSVGYKIPSIVNIFQQIFIQAWHISGVKEFDGEKEFYQNTFQYLNLCMCFAASGLLLLCKPLARILFAKEFYEAWSYVPFLLMSGVINASAGFAGPILSAKKDSVTMAKSAIYGAVTNLILNVVLVYLFGIQGATIATAVSSAVIFHVRKSAVRESIESTFYGKVMLSWGVLVVQSCMVICEVGIIWQFICMAALVLVYVPIMKEMLKIRGIRKK